MTAFCLSVLNDRRQPSFSSPPFQQRGYALAVDCHPGPTESEIIARYLQDGAECACRLSGDYSFVLWDEQQQLLLASRSITGRRPLYMARHPRGGLLCANDPRALLAQGVSEEQNQSWVACWLTRNEDHWRHSPWLKITPVLPGHSLIYQNETITIKPSWHPPERLRTADLSFEEAARMLRSLLVQAIKSRLQGHRVYSFDASGGLDSSSIVSLVAYLQELGEIDPGQIHVIHNYSKIHSEEDARQYIADLIARYAAIVPHMISLDELQSRPLDLQRGTYPFEQSVRMNSLLRETDHVLDTIGSSAHFSGIYGDQLFAPAIHLLAHLPLTQLPRALWDWRAYRAPLPLLYRALLTERATHKIRGYPGWISPEAVKLAEENQLAQDMAMRSWIPDPFQRSLIVALLHDQQLLTRHFAWDTREHLLPFLDQGLIEFLCRCPLPYLMAPGPGKNKGLLRQAMLGILPESVRRRTDKGNATKVIQSWSYAQSKALKALAEKEEAPTYVDGEGLISAIARFEYGDCRDQRFIYRALALICKERR